MILKKLTLKDFRNYTFSEIFFQEGNNVLFGKNGQGKTNILESIYYLALTKSFRTNNDQNLILHKKDFFRIQGELVSERGRPHKSAIGLSASEGKRLTHNDSRIYKFSEYIGTIPVVLLAPSDLEITQQGPQKRRHYLDVMLSQASKVYLNDLIEYRRALKQRNNILQSQNLNEHLLFAWEASLKKIGTNIIQKRKETVKVLDELVKKYYRQLSGSEDAAKIVYQNSFDTKETGETEENYQKAFDKSRQKDIETGRTTVGPHRDDLLFLIKGKPLRIVGSQGEHKTFTISLKIAEYLYLENAHSESPLLLFDDIFSELDQNRIMNMINTISEIGQVFITTTSPDFFGKFNNWETDTAFFEITNGSITALEEGWHRQNQSIN